jgi:hypothetical protein
MKIAGAWRQNPFIVPAWLAVFSGQWLTANAGGTAGTGQAWRHRNGGLANGIPALNGWFGAMVNFGAGIFTGSNYWLEAGVWTTNPANTSVNTVATPLQAVMPAPDFIVINKAGSLPGGVPESASPERIAECRFKA